MGSRTYEKGQELLLFLHAGGKAPVLGEISENLKFHRISGKSQNSIGIQKNHQITVSGKKYTFTKPGFSLGNIGVSAPGGAQKRKITKFYKIIIKCIKLCEIPVLFKKKQ